MTFINQEMVNVEMLAELIENLLKYMADNQTNMQKHNLENIALSLLDETKSFFKLQLNDFNDDISQFLLADPLYQHIEKPESPRHLLDSPKSED